MKSDNFLRFKSIFHQKNKLEKNRFRIVHIIGSLNVGGAEKVVTNIIKHSENERNTLFILCYCDGPLRKELENCNVEILVRPMKWWTIPLWIVKRAKEIKMMRINVVHTHLFSCDVLGRIIGKLVGVPVIISTLHAPSSWKMSETLRNRIKRIIDCWTANHLADRLVAVCEMVREYQCVVGKFALDKIGVITNPVITEEFRSNSRKRRQKRRKLGFNEDDIVITKVANLYKIKGHEYLLKAVALLVKDKVKVKLMLIGDGPLMQDLKDLACSLEIEKNILFLGVRDDVSELLCSSDIFVMASLSEGISMAILEAMAAGLPVVATCVGGNQELIKHKESGLLVEARNVKALAFELRYLIDNPKEKYRLSIAAMEYVRSNHCPRLIASQYEKCYREVLEEKENG